MTAGLNEAAEAWRKLDDVERQYCYGRLFLANITHAHALTIAKAVLRAAAEPPSHENRGDPR